jgi:hypothetical protein
MRALCAVAVLGLGLMGSMGSASAQWYGGPGYGYDEPEYEYRAWPEVQRA